MDRQALEIFYRGSAHGAFRKVLGGEQLDGVSLPFLGEHVQELEVQELVDVLRKPVAEGVDGRLEAFVVALAEKLAALFAFFGRDGVGLEFFSVPAGYVFDNAHEVDADAWADLTQRLRERVREKIWHRFVDHVRGGEIFNLLNDPICARFRYDGKPLVLPLLDERTNDLRAAEHVLSLPVNEILFVHQRLPDLLTRERVEVVVRGRVATLSERWCPPFPEWMAPHVVERLGHCLDLEALDLYTWLFSQPASSHAGNLHDLAVARFTVVLSGGNRALFEAWLSWTGMTDLTTRRAWKDRGRAFIETLVDLDCKFPEAVLTEALRGATETDGATPEKHRRAVLRTTHEVAAMVFVERAERAMRGEDWETAHRFLEAFMTLDPGSFVSGRVHHLRKLPDVPESLRSLIEACAELLRAGGKAPTETALSEAFAVLKKGGRS